MGHLLELDGNKIQMNKKQMSVYDNLGVSRTEMWSNPFIWFQGWGGLGLVII